jgi:hypothetical protein
VEHAAERTNIFARAEHRIVDGHDLTDSFVERLGVGDLATHHALRSV